MEKKEKEKETKIKENFNDNKKIKKEKKSKEDKKVKELEKEIKDKGNKKVKELEKEKKELEKNIEVFKDKYIRVHAEFDNSKKRLEKELRRRVDLITGDIFLDIIHIVDDMERALSANVNKKELEGTRLVYNKMLKLLEKCKVTPFESLNKEFDTDYHNALLVKIDNAKPNDTIVEEFEKGYMFNKKVLRHAKVIVSKKENTKVEEK